MDETETQATSEGIPYIIAGYGMCSSEGVRMCVLVELDLLSNLLQQANLWVEKARDFLKVREGFTYAEVSWMSEDAIEPLMTS
jgi:hypothetical protein